MYSAIKKDRQIDRGQNSRSTYTHAQSTPTQLQSPLPTAVTEGVNKRMTCYFGGFRQIGKDKRVC